MPITVCRRLHDTLDLPPGFRLVTLREVGDAFAQAIAIAGEAGAGTLVRVCRCDLVEFAVVLKPDEPLRNARCVFYAGLVALRDALATHSPPHRAITFALPDAILINGHCVGHARLGGPGGAAEDAPPDWLVFGVVLAASSAEETRVWASTLEEEGFDAAVSDRLIESWARHLLHALDVWQAHGFGPIAERYAAHLASEDGAARSVSSADRL